MCYIDDSYLQGDLIDECKRNVTDTLFMFSGLGFHTHSEKSVLQPTQALQFLVFVLNSVLMQVRPTEKKAASLKGCM